ncbi:FAD-dependent monooxygenase [Actinophytocola sp.]|uniref:FAD-dependent monooxygenase n=1 Tax=Actinophytocola sp. TaxID=1872138 RepID=UPI002D7FE3A9|nr:FAD-dependent monooxygenase [Actinophytocola sp.]HET9140454.1 FAD-dependent monooxygenase [Actinophytocola sp.]
MSQRVIVVGGGIGGLAAALAVARNGHEALVLERQDGFAELGAGIQLAPNAFRALEHLGVAAEARARAVFISDLRLMDGVAGVELTRLELTGNFLRRYGQPYAVVHRGDLYEPLLRACRADERITLRAGAAVTGYRLDGAGASVSLRSGEWLHGAAVIGADGLRSRIRAQLVGDGSPRVSGHTIYRSVIPIDEVPEERRWYAATLWAGPGYHMVHYPIADGASFNMALTVDDGAETELVGVPVPRDRVLEIAGPMRPEIRTLIELGRDWRSWVLCDRDPVDTWTDGPVLLVGDAAHPMLQYAAQGAAMALEDAVCLDTLLAVDQDLATAFGKLEALRAPRTARVQLISRRMGAEVYHPAGAAARARDELLGGMSEQDQFELLDWLYAHDEAPLHGSRNERKGQPWLS